MGSVVGVLENDFKTALTINFVHDQIYVRHVAAALGPLAAVLGPDSVF